MHVDALLVAQTVCIAAEAQGLGICYLGTTTYTANKIISLLNLPKGVVPVTTVTLGWPDEKPEQVDRLPLEAIIHREKYCDYSDENIEKYFKVDKLKVEAEKDPAKKEQLKNQQLQLMKAHQMQRKEHRQQMKQEHK